MIAFDRDEQTMTEVGSVRLPGASIVARWEVDDDGCGWRRKVILSGRSFPKAPDADCETDGRCWSRRMCDACHDFDAWKQSILAIVSRETGWEFYAFATGPGYSFRAAPAVYIRGSRIVVSQYGGLDV